MSLDFKLIQKSVNHLNEKIIYGSKPTATSALFLVEEFLHPELYKKISTSIKNNSMQWKSDGAGSGTQHYNNFRQVANWEPDTITEEINIVFEDITECIGQKLGYTNLKFGSSYIWKDVFPFAIGKHADQDLIKASVQVYIDVIEDTDLTTYFEYNNIIIKPQYKNNCGYFVNNQSKLNHWMTNPIPKNAQRHSLYAYWK